MPLYDLPDEIQVEADGPVRVVTLNRPDQLNAVNRAMHQGLVQVWPAIAADPEARVAVLTGAGKAFSAGGDFNHMLELIGDAEVRRAEIDAVQALLFGMARFPLPLIAAVNGPAVGLGCSLAASSDIVIASERSFFADPHVGVGLVCGDGGAVLWPLLTSMLRCKEFLFTGDRIPADQAVQLGLANRVVAPDQVMEHALALAHRLADKPQFALRETKKALQMHVERAIAGVVQAASMAELASMGSAEHERIVRSLIGDKAAD